MTPLRAVKGMNDVLPEEIGRWHRLEKAFAETFALHGYREVRTPCVEATPLFVRTIGEATDVVEKEMYSFRHHDDALTLRPEGTAGAARAYVEHGVQNREPVSRWYYFGAMFRAERPQRGRYRQFYQAGAEIYGDAGPCSDAEMIDMLVGLLHRLGVRGVEVFVNSLGSGDTRARYKNELVAFLEPKRASLSEDSQRRLGTNPLRILDSKDERDRAAVAAAPTVIDCLGDDDKAHFSGLQRSLDALGTPYRVDPRLVRGLDYYTRTLFEIKADVPELGTGNTVVGGGRYDNMVAELGGPNIPAIGFAAGIERLLIASSPAPTRPIVDVFVAPLGEESRAPALVLAKELRAAGISTEADTRGGSLKSLLRRANALGARAVVILGERELAEGVVELKDLAAHAQERVSRSELPRVLGERLRASPEGSEEQG